MPNWVTNHISLSCENEDTIKKLVAFVKSDDRNFDFNNIVEMPEALRNTESGSSVDDAWDYYQAKALGRMEALERRLTWPWVVKEGYKTVEELLIYYEKRNPDIFTYGEQLYELDKEYGCHDWYSWAVGNWGTKWNACESEVNDTEIYFNTAWSAIPVLIESLSALFPTVNIYYGWADEDFGNNCGEIIFLGGKVIDENIPEGGSDEANELAAKILGYEPDWDDDWDEEEEEE